MPMTKEQMLAVAALARLDLGVNAGAPLHDASDEASREARIDRLAGQLDAVIGYMDMLRQVDAEDVEPLYSPMSSVAGPRPDCAVKTLTVEEVLADAPQRQGTYFAVPPVPVI